VAPGGLKNQQTFGVLPVRPPDDVEGHAVVEVADDRATHDGDPDQFTGVVR
jgi:hypothetical protein